MYKKYLIVASKKDKAGINITTALSQFGDFKFHLIETDIVDDKGLDMDKINEYDFVIFASKHASEKGIKSLSVHAPGNFRNADYGGKPNKVCKSSALFQKQLFETLVSVAEEHNLQDYEITLECTHHGPLISKPCVFIEVGSSEMEWNDRQAAFIVAKTISKTIQEFKENPYREVVIGIGGPHYCPNFNKLQLKSNYALSHIIPEYCLPLTDEMIKEAVEKTEEEIDLALLDWKGMGNEEERKRILKILDDNYIRYKKTSEASREI